MSKELDTLEGFFPEVVAEMKDVFNTHHFILELARKHQHEYINALSAHSSGPHPFKTVHTAIAQRLSASGLVENIGREAESQDIFGQANTAAKWKKLAAS